MTDIKSVIKELEFLCECGEIGLTDEEKQPVEFAIRSLEAWEEVLQELKHDKEICFAHDSDEGFVYARVIDIIKQKLSEIEE